MSSIVQHNTILVALSLQRKEEAEKLATDLERSYKLPSGCVARLLHMYVEHVGDLSSSLKYLSMM